MGFWNKLFKKKKDLYAQNLKFKFESDPIKSTDIEYLVKVKVPGSKYYHGSLIYHLDMYDGINSDRIDLYIRTRFNNGKSAIKKKESLDDFAKLVSGFWLGEDGNWYLNPKKFLSGKCFDYFIEDLYYKAGVKRPRYILHFVREIAEKDMIEGFFVIDGESIDEEYLNDIKKWAKED